MCPDRENTPAATSPTPTRADTASEEHPGQDTARSPESVAAAAGSAETRHQRLRRNAHQGRLQAYALGGVILAAALIVLAASNTARVQVHWIFGSSRISLVWLVLLAALIGWTLGVLSSVRAQWVTRAPYPKRGRHSKRRPA